MVKTYLLTIKNNSNRFTDLDNLNREILTVKENTLKGRHADWHSHIAIELDSLCRLHAHAVIKTPNNMSCQLISKKYNHGSWHLNLTPVLKGTEDIVFDYIEKEHTDPSHLEQTAYEHNVQLRLKKFNLFSNSYIVYNKS